jgi:ArsR family transcriptional regulator
MSPERLIRIAKALGDPTRFRLLQAIASARGGELCCGDLARRFPIAQATVSHHLKILVDAELVESRRDGQHSWFRAVRPVLDEYRRALRQALQP